MYVLSLWYLSQGMVWAFSRVHLNFLVVQIDKMFTNPYRLYNLACVCLHPYFYVWAVMMIGIFTVTGAWLFRRGAQFKSVIIRYYLGENS